MTSQKQVDLCDATEVLILPPHKGQNKSNSEEAKKLPGVGLALYVQAFQFSTPTNRTTKSDFPFHVNRLRFLLRQSSQGGTPRPGEALLRIKNTPKISVINLQELAILDIEHQATSQNFAQALTSSFQYICTYR